MKKIYLLTLTASLLATQNLFAEQSMSKLEHVETSSCSQSEIARVIQVTANRVMFPNLQNSSRSANLTVLDEGLGLSLADKSQGLSSSVTGVRALFNIDKYDRQVTMGYYTVATAKYGKVITLAPQPYAIAFQVVDPANTSNVRKGVIKADITCRIEKKTPDSPMKYSARLLSYEVAK